MPGLGLYFEWLRSVGTWFSPPSASLWPCLALFLPLLGSPPCISPPPSGSSAVLPGDAILLRWVCPLPSCTWVGSSALGRGCRQGPCSWFGSGLFASDLFQSLGRPWPPRAPHCHHKAVIPDDYLILPSLPQGLSHARAAGRCPPGFLSEGTHSPRVKLSQVGVFCCSLESCH